MDQEERPEEIQRILVALDASPHSLAALRAAVELADALNAEIVGLYVEDVNVLRSADLPFARQITIFQHDPQQIDRQAIEQQLRNQARQARRALEAAATRHHLRWSFRVAQGIVPAELLSAAEEVDLIILGKSGWSRRRRMGSTTRVLVLQSPRQAIILGAGAHLGIPVGVVYDGSQLSQKSIRTALSVLQKQPGYLVVMILAEDMESARRLQSEVTVVVRSWGIHVHYRWLVGANIGTLRATVQAEGCGVLLLPGENDLFDSDTLSDLLDQVECPVWIMR